MKSLTPLLLLFIFGIAFSTAYPQNDSVHSFTGTLSPLQQDTCKVSALNSLCKKLIEKNNLKDAAIYAKTALGIGEKTAFVKGQTETYDLLATIHIRHTDYARARNCIATAMAIQQKLGEVSGISECYSMLAHTFYMERNYSNALQYFFLSLKTITQTGNTRSIAFTYSKIAEVYYRKENYSEALCNWYAALRLYEQAKDKQHIASSLRNIAGIYELQGNNTEALNNCIASQEIYNTINDQEGLAQLYNCMGLVYTRQGRHNVALQKHLAAYEIFTKLSNSATNYGIPQSYYCIGKVYEAMGNAAFASGDEPTGTHDFLIALKHYRLALQGWKRNKDAIGITEAYLRLGAICLKLKNVPDAKKYLEKSLAHSLNNSSRKNTMESYYFLALLDSAQHHYKLALHHYKYYILYRDSLLDEENTIKSLEAKMQYEYKKREVINKAKQYDERALAKAQISNQKTIRNLSWFVMTIIMLSGSYILYRYYGYKQLLEEQKLQYERQRISRELHDEMGSSLSGIVLYTYLAKDQIHTIQTEAAESSLTIIQQSANKMVENLGDLVWSVNPHQDSFKNLLQKLKEYAIQMSAAKNIMIDAIISEKVMDLKLSAVSRHNIYLLFKEAINNAVKYSNATLLRLSAQDIFNTAEFYIQDNGKGFDMAIVKRGNGLVNMQKRADEIGAILSIQSAPFRGTIISLQCKIT